MFDVKSAISMLKGKGYRITPQRVAVLRVLHNNTEHPTAEEIHRKTMKLQSNVSIATVYNVLEMLEKEGFIVVLQTPDGTRRYDPNTELHAHFVCERCNRIFDVELSQNLSKGLLFFVPEDSSEVKQINISFFGICKRCAQQQTS
ncbi:MULTISPECIES: Fur family transcriptional regulator [Kosmotoga]|jgi:Fur family peroxide stress response transcriptional regulator|uniref:Ferric uptake regulator, Fur family n=1 Tax=Kosmotoga olearia (strain ATCC BAA-1733 / DSM 21960 / TBF 19.5.1) TaxID=521045 RepID=C5CIP1_KOSOT|nr:MULTISPECIES: Fur family transcriptional regulator [Kosmotoga]ACR80824.1 ferric uptake regulator, Fur family [Kosmotoga olearia TBF 19.5.1]MDI3524578.1 Fur family transcriptional regulator, peroxide stress response regulator [Kosmotoga sp.]MDK2952692.1 Fur family transcriptional regulator, peroxide stress response regulator [Kosmotoga sp.]